MTSEKNKLKIIIAGGRDFNNYDYVVNTCEKVIDMTNKEYFVSIVSGCANGADKLGEKYALNNMLTVHKFPADWNTYGKRAGYLRNEQMAQNADMLIAFWNGESKGTKHMIDLALKHGLEVLVKRY